MVSLLSGFIFHLPHFLLLWLAFKMFQIVLELNQALCDQLVLCSSYRAFFSINKIGQRLLKAILPFFAFFFFSPSIQFMSKLYFWRENIFQYFLYRSRVQLNPSGNIQKLNKINLLSDKSQRTNSFGIYPSHKTFCFKLNFSSSVLIRQ